MASEKTSGLLDTGPQVSFFASGLRHHAWAREPVLTEAAFLLKREGRKADAIFALLERGAIRVAINLQDEQADLRALMRRYRNKPMSLADRGGVLTLDSDFRIYRRCGNKVIPVVMPD